MDTKRDHNAELEDKVKHQCGATSSKCPDFAQIPLAALEELSERFKLGEIKHGRDNWRKGLTDSAYVIERLNHIIYHAYKLIGKIEGKRPADGDSDAGALIWGGAFAVEAVRALEGQGMALVNAHVDDDSDLTQILAPVPASQMAALDYKPTVVRGAIPEKEEDIPVPEFSS